MQRINMKNLWKCIFMASRRVSFSYFLEIMEVAPPSPTNIFQNFSGLCYNIQLKPYEHLRWSSLWQIIGNDWKVLLVFVTQVLDSTLTINLDWLRQLSIPYAIYMFKVSKRTLEHCVKYTQSSRHHNNIWCFCF